VRICGVELQPESALPLPEPVERTAADDGLTVLDHELAATWSRFSQEI
jgi:hypothetical protein